MALWDLLTRNNNTIDYTKNMSALQAVPVLDAVQINNDGSLSNNPVIADEKAFTAYDKLANRTRQAGNKLFDKIFGEQAQPTDYVDTSNDVINVGVSSNPRVGGLLNDIASGARENFTTGFAAPNLYTKETADGRNKGFAYRIGEGLGTLGRIMESPLGRGLITAGIVGATGGNALQAMAYGGQAGVLNQANRNRNEIYRQQLEDQGIDTSNIRGYVTDDTYKNILQGKTLQDNAEYRKMYFDQQQKNLEEQQAWRQQQAEIQRAENAANRALTARGQDLTYGLGMARLEADKNKDNTKQSASQKDAMSTLSQIGLIRDMVKNNPNATGLAKGMLTGDLLNRFDSKQNNIQTRTAIDALRTKIRHDLTGAQFSPKEAREYEKFLPNVRDNADIINAKLDALEKRYYADFGVSLSGNTDNNPLGLSL